MSKDKNNINVEKETMSSVISLIRKKCFYGHILRQLQKVFFDNSSAMGKAIPTMAVGKQKDEMLLKLYVNTDFVKRFYAEAESYDKGATILTGILEHEVLHVVFNHLSLKFSDRERAAIAMDLAVNSFIPKDQLPEDGQFPDRYKLEAKKSAFWYYQHLEGNEQFEKMKKDGAFGEDGELEEIVKSHDIWKNVDDELAEDMLKDIVRKAKDLSESTGYGDVPQEVQEQIEKLIKRQKPKVPWNRILRTFVASSTESELDYTMKRSSRRFGTRPGTRKEDIVNLAVAVDTSGSISASQLRMFMNEISWIHRNGAKVTIFEADCQLQRSYPFKGKFKGEMQGRGGTDLEPVLKETEGKFDALVYLTDMEAPTIEKKYRIPTLWVISSGYIKEGSEYCYPWGRHIHIDQGEASGY